MILLLKGLLFGLLLAATVGPMWVLCFRCAIAHGADAGYVSGMGILGFAVWQLAAVLL